MILPLFISIDVATTWILSSAADVVWRQTHGSSSIRKLIFSLYAFNPITIVSTGILSLTVIQNFVSAVILLSLVTGKQRQLLDKNHINKSRSSHNLCNSYRSLVIIHNLSIYTDFLPRFPIEWFYREIPLPCVGLCSDNYHIRRNQLFAQ